MSLRITSRDVVSMSQHWLSCPVNGYLGSGYGSELKSLIQSPMAAGLAEGIIAKAMQDIPLLLQMPDQVNLYTYDTDLDVKALVFEVSGELIQVDGGTTVSAIFNEAPPVDLALALIDTVTQTGAEILKVAIHQTIAAEGYF